MKRFALPLILVLLLSPFVAWADFDISLPPMAESKAFQLYSKQPKSELSKLLFLMNRFKESKALVLYNGYEYQAPEAMRLARNYLMKKYKKEEAAFWVKKYCYKTNSGSVILLKAPDGKTRPALDVAVEELATLEKLIS